MASLTPSPKMQFFDANGNPLSGGKLYTYAAGTTTPQATYTDSTGGTPNANPVVMNSRGEASVWLGSSLYYMELKDSTDVLIWTADNIGGQASQFDLLAYEAALAASGGSSLVGFLQSGSDAVARTVQSKLRDIVSLKDFGAVCDGVTDDTTEVQAAITSIGTSSKTLLIPGPTKISGNLTFGASTELWFLDGGYFLGTAGTEILQVQRQMVSGPHVCFSTCAPIATNGMTVLPEWFGASGDGTTDDKAAIQLAVSFLVNTGGVVQFDARTYNMSANVNITGSNTVLKGKGQNSTKIRTTSGTATAFQFVGTAVAKLYGCSIQDMTINKSVAGTGGGGIVLRYTAVFKAKDVAVVDYLHGVDMLRSTNTIAERVLVTFSGTTNNWRGFKLDGGGTGAGGNASSVFRDCWVDGTGASGTGGIGFYAFGAYVSDLLFDGCETTTIGIGFEFDCTTSSASGNEDVQLINCRADQIINYGIYILNAATDSMFSVIGGWFNGKNTSAETDSIFLDACRGISITGVQFYNDTNYANGYHIKMTNCINVIATGCLFTGMKYGVYMTGTGYGNINGNRFWCQSGRTATAFVTGTGCARMMVNNNAFDGYATQAVIFDATSSGCGIVGNTANITNITTRFTNAGSGPVGGADGSTGLNSGI